jgi:hypothetical protein
MTSPIGANTPAAAQGTSEVDPTRLETMGPQELLSFGSAIAHQLDDDVRTSINSMMETSDAGRRISALRQEVHDLSVQHSESGKKRTEKLTISGDAFWALDPEVRELLGAKEGDTQIAVSQDMLDQADTKLELQQNDINSGQETRMMAVQEAMRQRSQLVQLLSNILREQGETNLAVVRNIQ